MNRDTTIGIIVVALLLGGIFLLARRPAAAPLSASASGRIASQGSIKFIQAPERRYRNKETRNIEYNADGLPTRIEIIRDFAIA